mmetsp:Transcript_13832/g.21851  ORF Transcript_13832/g.21851 Transcript_13832/m.21851 type:complete len:84 (+) Transcript_13832:2206-2457(+)
MSVSIASLYPSLNEDSSAFNADLLFVSVLDPLLRGLIDLKLIFFSNDILCVYRHSAYSAAEKKRSFQAALEIPGGVGGGGESN